MHFHHKLQNWRIVIALPSVSRTHDRPTANRYRHNYTEILARYVIINTFLCFDYINFIIVSIILQN